MTYGSDSPCCVRERVAGGGAWYWSMGRHAWPTPSLARAFRATNRRPFRHLQGTFGPQIEGPSATCKDLRRTLRLLTKGRMTVGWRRGRGAACSRRISWWSRSRGAARHWSPAGTDRPRSSTTPAAPTWCNSRNYCLICTALLAWQYVLKIKDIKC